jgi:hypothetical protein
VAFRCRPECAASRNRFRDASFRTHLALVNTDAMQPRIRAGFRYGKLGGLSITRKRKARRAVGTAPCREVWSAPAERSGDGALGSGGADGQLVSCLNLTRQSGVALRLPPHSKTLLLRSNLAIIASCPTFFRRPIDAATLSGLLVLPGFGR